MLCYNLHQICVESEKKKEQYNCVQPQTRINTSKSPFLSKFFYFDWAYFFPLVLASRIQRDMVT